MKRRIALTLTALLAVTVGAAAAANPSNDDHRTALAALADIEAARAEIVRIEDSQSVGHPAFLHAAQRALNAVVGRDDRFYVVVDGDPGDATGAIGNIDRLLDRRDESLWTGAMQGAKANLLAVVVNLHDAMQEKQIEDYQADLTEALASMALASGRPSEDGVLGGLSGALANTSLGVPPGAPTVSGCTVPSHGPAYGVVSGRLAYIALPRISASPIPQEFSVSRVVVSGDAVVLYTRQTDRIDALCRRAHRERIRRVTRADPGDSAASVKLVARDVTAKTATNAASYITAQAQAGLAVFTANCESCHGADLQGVAAPGVAGTEFLGSVKNNKWTLKDMRNLVFENMPLYNPGMLTPEQYAEVMAFLLASNCYPAGSTPFPQKDDPAFATVLLGPVTDAHPTDSKLGTCAVK